MKMEIPQGVCVQAGVISPDRPYEDRSFKCQCCGACCRIKDGICRVSDAEIARIAAFLGRTEADFIANETEVAPDRKTLMLKSRYRALAVRLLEKISTKIKTEKQKVALLLYATAQDVSITDATVLEGLEIEKSRAYAIREKAMNCLRRELKGHEGAGDPLFVRMLLETCEANLSESVRTKMGGAQ